MRQTINLSHLSFLQEEKPGLMSHEIQAYVFIIQMKTRASGLESFNFRFEKGALGPYSEELQHLIQYGRYEAKPTSHFPSSEVEVIIRNSLKQASSWDSQSLLDEAKRHFSNYDQKRYGETLVYFKTPDTPELYDAISSYLDCSSEKH